MGSHILEISGVTKFWAKSYLDGCVDGHRVVYNGAGVLRGQRQTSSKN